MCAGMLLLSCAPCLHPTACPKGKYTTGEATCVDCPKGSYCVGGIYSLDNPPVNVSCPENMTTLGRRAASARSCGEQGC